MLVRDSCNSHLGMWFLAIANCRRYGEHSRLFRQAETLSLLHLPSLEVIEVEEYPPTLASNMGAVKQEIAKEGILPYSLFFAKSYDLSLSTIFRGRSPKGDFNTISSEKTPAAALALHWVLTNIIVVGAVLAIQPQPYSSTPAFTFMSIVFAYIIYVTVFIFISFGLLCLRFSRRVRWAEKSEFKHPWVSVIAALILFTGSLFLLIFMWVPDPAYPTLPRTSNLVPWYAAQTFGLSIVAFAFLYWVGLRCYVRVRSAREGKTLYVKREPKFRVDAGGLTQIAEIVTLQWVREVGMWLGDIGEAGDQRGHQDIRPAPGEDHAQRRAWASGAAVRGYSAGRQEPQAPDAMAGLHHYAWNPDRQSAGVGQRVHYEEGRQQGHEMYELPAAEQKQDEVHGD